MKVVIVDYRMGNIQSIVGALKYLNVEDIVVSNDSYDIFSANKDYKLERQGRSNGRHPVAVDSRVYILCVVLFATRNSAPRKTWRPQN
mgnify:CR=1 FL=1